MPLPCRFKLCSARTENWREKKLLESAFNGPCRSLHLFLGKPQNVKSRVRLSLQGTCVVRSAWARNLVEDPDLSIMKKGNRRVFAVPLRDLVVIAVMSRPG